MEPPLFDITLGVKHSLVDVGPTLSGIFLFNYFNNMREHLDIEYNLNTPQN